MQAVRAESNVIGPQDTGANDPSQHVVIDGQNEFAVCRPFDSTGQCVTIARALDTPVHKADKRQIVEKVEYHAPTLRHVGEHRGIDTYRSTADHRIAHRRHISLNSRFSPQPKGPLVGCITRLSHGDAVAQQ